jgi:hypothetical protein
MEMNETKRRETFAHVLIIRHAFKWVALVCDKMKR